MAEDPKQLLKRKFASTVGSVVKPAAGPQPSNGTRRGRRDLVVEDDPRRTQQFASHLQSLAPKKPKRQFREFDSKRQPFRKQRAAPENVVEILPDEIAFVEWPDNSPEARATWMKGMDMSLHPEDLKTEMYVLPARATAKEGEAASGRNSNGVLGPTRSVLIPKWMYDIIAAKRLPKLLRKSTESVQVDVGVDGVCDGATTDVVKIARARDINQASGGAPRDVEMDLVAATSEAAMPAALERAASSGELHDRRLSVTSVASVATTSKSFATEVVAREDHDVPLDARAQSSEERCRSEEDHARPTDESSPTAVEHPAPVEEQSVVEPSQSAEGSSSSVPDGSASSEDAETAQPARRASSPLVGGAARGVDSATMATLDNAPAPVAALPVPNAPEWLDRWESGCELQWDKVVGVADFCLTPRAAERLAAYRAAPDGPYDGYVPPLPSPAPARQELQRKRQSPKAPGATAPRVASPVAAKRREEGAKARKRPVLPTVGKSPSAPKLSPSKVGSTQDRGKTDRSGPPAVARSPIGQLHPGGPCVICGVEAASKWREYQDKPACVACYYKMQQKEKNEQRVASGQLSTKAALPAPLSSPAHISGERQVETHRDLLPISPSKGSPAIIPPCNPLERARSFGLDTGVGTGTSDLAATKAKKRMKAPDLFHEQEEVDLSEERVISLTPPGDARDARKPLMLAGNLKSELSRDSLWPRAERKRSNSDTENGMNLPPPSKRAPSSRLEAEACEIGTSPMPPKLFIPGPPADRFDRASSLASGDGFASPSLPVKSKPARSQRVGAVRLVLARGF
ncbi:hypothetical protein DFJ74DRAFT_653781 [Hyaloraphidium curvatum]|nr:hypothetical protein DFJ74DRAFT_653781 [Hyaloraphidium curvatum]